MIRFSPVSSLFFRAFLILDPVVMPLLSGKITTCTQNDDFNPLGNLSKVARECFNDNGNQDAVHQI
jgi:hypothetical protein